MIKKSFVISLCVWGLVLLAGTGCNSDEDGVSLPSPFVHFSFDTNTIPVPDEAGSGVTAGEDGQTGDYQSTGGVDGTGAFLFGAALDINDETGKLMDANLYGDNGYAISAWVKPEDTTDDAVYSIVSRFQGYSLQIQKGDFYFWVVSPDLNGDFTYKNETRVRVTDLSADGANGKWWHLVGVANETSVLFYVNGELVDEIDDVTFNRNMDETQTTAIGDGFKGIIDEVLIYNEPLDAEQVKQLYEQKVVESE